MKVSGCDGVTQLHAVARVKQLSDAEVLKQMLWQGSLYDMVWYGMAYVSLYNAIAAHVSDALRGLLKYCGRVAGTALKSPLN